MLSARPLHINVENVDSRPLAKAPATGSKTPGRALLKSRSGLRENVVGSHTVQRHALNNKHTPFRTKTQQHSNKPLLDKTPFHNRQNPLSTPAPQTFKIAKLGLEDNIDYLNAPGPGTTILRPSSTRKSLRGRASGEGSSEKALKALLFQTPVNQGHHWDVSDISIEVPSENELKEETIQDDYDEIEYMPPKGPELPYQPPFDFDIPNYKEVGLNLRSLAQSYKFDDEDELLRASEEIKLSEGAANELARSSMPRLELPELVDDDDPFSINRLLPKHSISKVMKIADRRLGKSESRSTSALVPHKAPSKTIHTAKPVVVPTVIRLRPPGSSSGTSVRAPRSASGVTFSKAPADHLNTTRRLASTGVSSDPKPRARQGAPIASKAPKPMTNSLKKDDELLLVFDADGEIDGFRFSV